MYGAFIRQATGVTREDLARIKAPSQTQSGRRISIIGRWRLRATTRVPEISEGYGRSRKQSLRGTDFKGMFGAN